MRKAICGQTTLPSDEVVQNCMQIAWNPPVAGITVTPANLQVLRGQFATVSWSSQGARTCSFTYGNQTLSGTSNPGIQVQINADTTFNLSCRGPGGTATDSKTVIMLIPPPTVSLMVNGSRNPGAVALNANITIAWTATDVTNCTLAPLGWQSPNTSFSRVTQASGPTTFTVSCTGPGGGPVTDTVSISVLPPGVSLTINGLHPPPALVVTLNSVITVAWVAANATSCTLSPLNWTAPGSWTGSATATAAATYTVTCTGPGGPAASDSISFTVTSPCSGNDHMVFLTRNVYNGNLGGAQGADAKCQLEADQNPDLRLRYPNTRFAWKAVLASDGNLPAARIPLTYPNVVSSTVWTALVNSGNCPASINSTGTFLQDGSTWSSSTHSAADGADLITNTGKDSHTWTGIGSGFSLGFNCNNWTSSGGVAHVGDTYDNRPRDRWHDGSSAILGCGETRSLRCISVVKPTNRVVYEKRGGGGGNTYLYDNSATPTPDGIGGNYSAVATYYMYGAPTGSCTTPIYHCGYRTNNYGYHYLGVAGCYDGANCPSSVDRCSNLQYEVVGYACTTQVVGTVPIYRFTQNHAIGRGVDHRFSTSASIPGWSSTNGGAPVWYIPNTP